MRKVAFFQIILAGVLWGTSGIFVHFLSPYGFSNFQLTAVRGWVSFLCLFVFALFHGKRFFLVKPLYLLLFAAIGACLFLISSCYYQSMQLTTIAAAVVLMYTAPIYVTFFSAVFFQEHLTGTKIMLILCMLVGCLFVSGIIGSSGWNGRGIWMGILSGIFYAGYILLTKVAVQCRIEPLSVTLYSFLFMSLISVFVSEPASLWKSVTAAPAATLPMLFGLGVVTFVLPYVLYTLALRILPAGICSALSIVDPMSAMLFGLLFFREPLNLFSVLGIILILFAVFQIGLQESKEKKKGA